MDASTASSSGPKPCGRRPSPDRRGGPAGTAQVARTQEDTAARYTRLVYSDITLGSEGDQENARVPAVRRGRLEREGATGVGADQVVL